MSTPTWCDLARVGAVNQTSRAMCEIVSHERSAPALRRSRARRRGHQPPIERALDALACLTEPTFSGCLIPVKAIGMFSMADEQGQDDKIICVPVTDPNWSRLEQLADFPEVLREEIEQFCAVYKLPEPAKHVEVRGWRSRLDALHEIALAQERADRAK